MFLAVRAKRIITGFCFSLRPLRALRDIAFAFRREAPINLLLPFFVFSVYFVVTKSSYWFLVARYWLAQSA